MKLARLLSILIQVTLIQATLIISAVPAPVVQATSALIPTSQATGTDEDNPLAVESAPLLTTPAGSALKLIPTANADAQAVSAAAAWNYDPTSVYDQKGLFQPRGFQAGAPTESIDP